MFLPSFHWSMLEVKVNPLTLRSYHSFFHSTNNRTFSNTRHTHTPRKHSSPRGRCKLTVLPPSPFSTQISKYIFSQIQIFRYYSGSFLEISANHNAPGFLGAIVEPTVRDRERVKVCEPRKREKSRLKFAEPLL